MLFYKGYKPEKKRKIESRFFSFGRVSQTMLLKSKKNIFFADILFIFTLTKLKTIARSR